MLPPPAPTVCTSTMGTWIGMPCSSSISAVTAGTPSSTRPTSALVPPVSKVIRSRHPAARPMAAAAMTPEAGPESTVLTAFAAAERAETLPPLPWITSSSRP